MAMHYLYLTNSRMVSLVAGRHAFTLRREFPVTDEGFAAFGAHLDGLTAHEVHFFTDLAEEDFRTDAIPHVAKGDREALIARKLGQIYRNAPYRHGGVQGRESTGRRDDCVVYAAITSADVIKPWLDAIQKREVALAGMHSAALMGARLLQTAGVHENHVLLVHVSAGQALRQTYFRRRELRLTRLTHVDLHEGLALGALLAQETTRTWQHLDNLRSLAAADRLHVVILAHPRDHAMLAASLQGSELLSYQLLDSEAIAAKIGLQRAPPSSSAEEILIRLFARAPVGNHYATPQMRRHWRLRRTRNAILAAATGVLTLGLGVGGASLATIARTAEGDQRAANEVLELNRAYDQLSRSLPALGVGGSAMRDAVTFYNSFIQGYPSIAGFIVPLSAALEGRPRVRLTQFAWQASDDPRATPAIVPQPARVPPPVKAIARTDVAVREAPNEDASAPLSAGRYEIALLEATVDVPSHDFRGALAEVEAFVTDIRKLEGCQADVVESPLDVRPSLALQGRNSERQPGSMEARFVVRVVRSRKGNA
jgi:hypothetical protein